MSMSSVMALVREPVTSALLTLPEAALRLRRSKRTIMRMNADGQIRLVHIRSHWFCPTAEVERIERSGTGPRED